MATISILQERTIRESALVNEQLQSALNSRVLIEQAKGVIAHTAGVDMEEAFRRLRSHARSNNRSLPETATAVINGVLRLVATAPVVAVTETGVRTTSAEYEFDVIVLATGFDAMTGPLLEMGIVGRGGQKLADKWADGPHTYLGLSTHGFPNLFFITGPQSPSVLSNMPLAIEDHVDFVADAIDHLRQTGLNTIEPTRDAEASWVRHANELAQATLLPGTDSWWMGANIVGKPRVCLVYLGGAPAYRQICSDVVAKGYEGFALSLEGSARELTSA